MIFCLGTMILWPATLAVLLVIGGVEKNPGPAVEAEKILQVLCRVWNRNLKLRTQCNKCGLWLLNSCDNFVAQVVENGKWICVICSSERPGLLEEKTSEYLTSN